MTTFTLFAHPALLALLAVPLVLAVWAWRASRRRPAVALPTAHRLEAITPTWRTRLRWLPAACLLAAAAALIVSLAHPQEGRRKTLIDSEGIAIELVVDLSGSMRAMDFKIDGQPVDRLTAVKRVASNFMRGDGEDLAGRSTDLVGLVTFARYADAVSPLTLDHAFVIDGLEDAQIVNDRNEDGTALGDGLGLALERLQALDTKRKTAKSGETASKVVILLTDGENNSGVLDPLAAAELAQAIGVRVYTIGVGTHGTAPVPRVMPFTGRTVTHYAPVSIDEDTLTQMAETTGGAYFRATDTESLAGVYARIDELEKVKLEERFETDLRELAVDSWGRLPPVLGIAAGLLAAGVLLDFLVFRRT